ncbi:MAG: CbiX/SirB N-terminal domain-containing protein [Peptococcaceae bacterium]|nr:CbiX/SirB N-terminal domain-containing protein [Peptococcaceae bacterium]MBQ2860144.1 CbiX/SirB N-terminal domain-containing protein [Peptococcaceae bacterium]MBQ2995474.1 CbiX/SirB N-terminal domain-containing protein [Peptococcaceae bacterium]MBQ7025374.1 CbiX/SirB N-terminal domain-containing protein [Peptococcaceae bacterium]
MNQEIRQAVVLLGHGSIREEANKEVRAMWDMMQDELPELEISGCFVEVAEPTMEQEIDRLAAEGFHRIVIVPMFLTRGQHLSNGIPRILEAMRQKYTQIQIDLTRHLGIDPLLAEIIKNRLREAGVE